MVVALTVGAMAAGAGIYKWAAPEPVIVPPTIVPPTPEPMPSKPLLDRLMLEYVIDSKSPGRPCLIDGPKLPSVRYVYKDGKWIYHSSGDRCDGLETWEIDDVTGAIKYVGSQKSPYAAIS